MTGELLDKNNTLCEVIVVLIPPIISSHYNEIKAISVHNDHHAVLIPVNNVKPEYVLLRFNIRGLLN